MVENIPASVLFSGNTASFFPSSGNPWEIIVQGNPYFRPKETEFRANNGFHKQKKAVNKMILFSIDINSDSNSQNEGFVQKNTFPLCWKTAFTCRNI